MTERIPCSQYDATSHSCKSGHVRTHTVCWGGNAECPTCGSSGEPPICMREDLPAHLISDNGMPRNWPKSCP